MEEILSTLLSFFLVVLFVYCAWRCVSKMGHPGRVCLLLLVPIVNIVFFVYLVNSEWPIERELERYKKLCGALPTEEEERLTEDSICLSCGDKFSEDSDECPSCGWSFKAESEIG